MAKYFAKPFGENGDLNIIPDDIQVDGSVSFEQGWGNFYQLNPATDPNAKRLERTKHNYLFNVVTDNIKEWQEQTFADWISDKGDGSPFAYNKDAIVTYTDGRAYVSLVDSNIGEPTIDTANWKLFEDFGSININGLTEKTTPVDNDEFAIADSATSFSLKKLSWANLKQTFFNSLGLLTAFATTKTSPISGDFIVLSDTEDSFSTKKTTILNILNKFSFTWSQTLQQAELTDTGATFTDGTPKFRQTNVTYTNNTGKLIIVKIQVGAIVNGYIDGVAIYTTPNIENSTIYLFVPNGSTYSTNGTPENWFEYR